MKVDSAVAKPVYRDCKTAAIPPLKNTPRALTLPTTNSIGISISPMKKPKRAKCRAYRFRNLPNPK